ncbi:MAG TPA: exodeoxyribonuclease VII small subunit [Anaerolineae bacterium]|nr:exodeoxyribonuclease VII small subunit [Anaerolineae bacterium]
MPKRESKEPSFEELYTELEATIEKLEAGNLSLDEALALYERGMELAKRCNTMLDGAELRIQELAPELDETDELDEEDELLDEDDE